MSWISPFLMGFEFFQDLRLSQAPNRHPYNLIPKTTASQQHASGTADGLNEMPDRENGGSFPLGYRGPLINPIYTLAGNSWVYPLFLKGSSRVKTAPSIPRGTPFSLWYFFRSDRCDERTYMWEIGGYCWWFRNRANQLRLVVYPIIYKVLYIHTVVVWDFFHQQYHPPLLGILYEQATKRQATNCEATSKNPGILKTKLLGWPESESPEICDLWIKLSTKRKPCRTVEIVLRCDAHEHQATIDCHKPS